MSLEAAMLFMTNLPQPRAGRSCFKQHQRIARAKGTLQQMLTLVLTMFAGFQITASQQPEARHRSKRLDTDVPFACLYRTLFEPSRQWLEDHTHMPHKAPASIHLPTLTINAVASSTACATAAAVTTPFDVVKTKLQIRDAQLACKGTWDRLVHVAKTGGAKALFPGWGASRIEDCCSIQHSDV